MSGCYLHILCFFFFAFGFLPFIGEYKNVYIDIVRRLALRVDLDNGAGCWPHYEPKFHSARHDTTRLVAWIIDVTGSDQPDVDVSRWADFRPRFVHGAEHCRDAQVDGR